MRILIYVILLLVAFVNITLARPRSFDSDLTDGETSLKHAARAAENGKLCSVEVFLHERLSDSSEKLKPRKMWALLKFWDHDGNYIDHLKYNSHHTHLIAPAVRATLHNGLTLIFRYNTGGSILYEHRVDAGETVTVSKPNGKDKHSLRM